MPSNPSLARRLTAFRTLTSSLAVVAFGRSLLRGVAQVIFLDNGHTGLLCLLGIFLASPAQCAAAIIGTAASTAAAHLLKADKDDIESGLYGYNGCLVALALPMYLGSSAAIWALAIVAAALSSVLLLAIRRSKRVWLPALTAPFVLCSWLSILALGALLQATSTGSPSGATRTIPVPPEGFLSGWPLVEATFSGIGQVYLQSGPVSGLVIALALLVGSRPVFLIACAAGFTSAAVASQIGVPDAAIRSGLFGFNAVLAAIAIGAVYLRPSKLSLVLGLSLAAAMPLFQTLWSLALLPAGLPTMSVPFITATWLALLALRPFRLTAAPPALR